MTNSPPLPIVNTFVPEEFFTRKRSTACPVAPWIVTPTALDVVATTLTTDPESGVVVPKEDCPTPLTRDERSANAAALIGWRGESVSEELLSAETSTWRYTVSSVLKSYVSVSGYPFAVSPTFILKTPSRTVAVVVAGVVAGQSCTPAPTVELSQIENLK